MPATTERPRPVHVPSLLDDSLPPRRRSPPPYVKVPVPELKPPISPPSSTPSTPKPLPSPKVDKKAPPSPRSPESEPSREDKVDPKRDDKPESLQDKSDDIIDMETFQQILELDDDGGDEFSREMVFAYFTQAESTFESMDHALQTKNLAELSSLGHFLKGSSAALGVCKVQASCEKIQHYGQLRDEEEDRSMSPKEALDRIGNLLSQVKAEYAVAEKWLKDYYAKNSS